MPFSDSERLLRLETKVAYQDKLILELNEVVVDLNRNVSDLSKRLVSVERLLRSEFERRDMPNDPPPHY